MLKKKPTLSKISNLKKKFQSLSKRCISNTKEKLTSSLLYSPYWVGVMMVRDPILENKKFLKENWSKSQVITRLLNFPTMWLKLTLEAIKWEQYFSRMKLETWEERVVHGLAGLVNMYVWFSLLSLFVDRLYTGGTLAGAVEWAESWVLKWLWGSLQLRSVTLEVKRMKDDNMESNPVKREDTGIYKELTAREILLMHTEIYREFMLLKVVNKQLQDKMFLMYLDISKMTTCKHKIKN